MTKSPSFRGLSWHDLKSHSSPFIVNRIRKELGLSKVVAELLTLRQLEKLEEIEAFMYPRSEHCSDPFLMADMEIAVERILKALSQGESLVVYGDYDVDGTAGAVILYRYLKRIGRLLHPRQSDAGVPVATLSHCFNDHRSETMAVTDVQVTRLVS